MTDIGTIIKEYEASRKIEIETYDKFTLLANKDPIAFAESDLGYYSFDTKNPIRFQDWERKLIRAIIYSDKKRRGMGDIKKNLKTTKSAAIVWIEAHRHPGSEFYFVANDLKQAASRAFNYLINTIETSPRCRNVKYGKYYIELPNGSVIQAIPMDWRGEAGSNPAVVVFDEVHAFRGTAAERMVSEMTIPPNIPWGYHLFTSYAGFDEESIVWQPIYDSIFELSETGEESLRRGVRHIGADVKINWSNEDYSSDTFPLYESEDTLLYWSHGPLEGDPGQPDHIMRWFATEQATLATYQFMRLCRNRWVSGTEESIFIENNENLWERCVANSFEIVNGVRIPYTMPTHLPNSIPIFGGLDGSTVNDHTAFASVYWNQERQCIALGPCKIWRPSHKDPMDISQDVMGWLRNTLFKDFRVWGILADPHELHQMITDMQRLNYPIEKYSQTEQNLMPAADTLFNLVKNNGILLPPDKDLKRYADNAAAKRKARGFIFMKEKSSKKIDFILALSFACVLMTDNMARVPKVAKPRGKPDFRKLAMEQSERDRIDNRADIGNLDLANNDGRKQSRGWGWDRLPRTSNPLDELDGLL